MRDRKQADPAQHVIAIVAALCFHVLLGATVIWAGKEDDHVRAPLDESRFDNARVVEVGLVRKGKKKDDKKMVERETIDKVAPTPGEKLTTNANATAVDPKNKPKTPDPRAEVDPLKAAQERARQMASPDAVPQGDGKKVEKAGAEDGSEWGNSATAKGDKYLAEVVGKIQANWDVPPALISEEELLTLKLIACLKVDASGKIVDFRIEKPSRSSRFDGTFKDAVEKTGDVGAPFGEFKNDIIQEGICLRWDKSGGAQ